MSSVTLDRIFKRYGDTTVIPELTLEIAEGEFVVLVGPSGCGKSTLLRMIAGLEDISGGELRIDGLRVNEAAPDARGLAMVFQSYALYPHMTVEQNMGFALRLAGVPKPERARKVAEAADILQLRPLLDRRPGQLSGGQRQRVAIGRAIVRQPGVFLFDEPLSNLDAALRAQMRVEISRLHARLASTMIYVTHDQIEAMTMADRIVVLRDGRIEQVGTPMDLYRRPANTFVAGFIGAPKTNLLEGRVVDGELKLAQGGVCRIPAGVDPGLDGPVTLGLRPESLRISDEGPLRGSVSVVEHLGSESLIHVDIGGDILVVVKEPEISNHVVGSSVALNWDGGAALLFDATGAAVSTVAQ